MIPRSEYPRPQFVRPGWMNLNGEWQFEIDHGGSGRARGLAEKNPLERTILVPFCPESELSGVGYKDFMEAVWYRRTFTLPKEAIGQRVLLHFGAVDYKCEAWINGQSVGVHEGGYVSFEFEITDALKEGEKVQIVGFGSIEVKSRVAHKGHNPITKEEMMIPETKSPFFKAGKILKDSVR